MDARVIAMLMFLLAWIILFVCTAMDLRETSERNLKILEVVGLIALFNLIPWWWVVIVSIDKGASWIACPIYVVLGVLSILGVRASWMCK